MPAPFSARIGRSVTRRPANSITSPSCLEQGGWADAIARAKPRFRGTDRAALDLRGTRMTQAPDGNTDHGGIAVALGGGRLIGDTFDCQRDRRIALAPIPALHEAIAKCAPGVQRRPRRLGRR